MGPLWISVEGCELTAEDRDVIAHPNIGGVILFAKNFHDSQQLMALTQSIRKAARGALLIGVDQEGGRVQRFHQGFSRLPTAQSYASVSDGERLAELGGWLMAAEIIAHDIDISFAPVLDKGHINKAIGTRAFGNDIDTIISHSAAFMKGMKSLGMATTGKHFPGHGGLLTDSHTDIAIDPREDIFEQDMAIFKAHILANRLDAVMPAHVIYPHYDARPASGSEFWLKQVLREQLEFSGIVFSDDLSMKGAGVMGSAKERARSALSAGCDMVLFCNDRAEQVEVIDDLPMTEVNGALRLAKSQKIVLKELQASQAWKSAVNQLALLFEHEG